MNIERTARSMLGIVMGLAVLSAAGIFTGTFDFGSEMTYALADFAVLAGFVALAAGFLMGDRSLDGIEPWEFGVVAVAVAFLAGVHFEVTFITGLITDYHPFTGAAAALVSYVGYHRLQWG